MKKVLIVHYGPGNPSHTRKSVDMAKELLSSFDVEVVERDLAAPHAVPLHDSMSLPAYVERNYKKQELSEEQTSLLEPFDALAQELLDADFLILAFPIYNFNIPAAVKGWIDAVAQAGKLFRYTEYGPEGLSKAKHALVLTSSGTTAKGSSKDFATPYIDYVLRFLGFQEITIHGLFGTRLSGDKEAQLRKLQEDIQLLFSSWFA